ncbi:hypothetical protein [Methylobacterium indicum]|uniref:Uncharacterized protein n=1 Tax=Methylobacterium indicum TaxID=1775910 RepID=A0A8H8X0A5_9HYPH|nr:hypothetical protein [Methylobacterium indicum]BCM87758.1 hypothetical protein mvi_62190 [Methylobacterium indicum]
MKILKYLVVAMLAMASPALAQKTDLMQPLTPTVTIYSTPEGTTHPLGISGPAGVTPLWNIAQWGTYLDLQPAVNSGVPWTIANDYARMKFEATDSQDAQFSNVYELAQSNQTCEHERDLFLQPNGLDSPNPGFQKSAHISELGSLYGSVILRPQYFQTSSDCAYQYAQYVYSIVLQTDNHPGHPELEQTWFYQINIGRDAYFPTQTYNGWCPGYDDVNNPLFCSDDDVRNMNTGFFVFGNAGGKVDFDMLPRIKELIKSNHQKVGAGAGVTLDPDPSHWRVLGAYIGAIGQGKTVMTVRVSDPKFVQYQGGTFPDGQGKAVQFICNVSAPPNDWGWSPQADGCFHRQTQNQY